MRGRERSELIRHIRIGSLVIALWIVTSAPGGNPIAPWGFKGHEMAARSAVATLPDEVPAFFRGATEQLVWLNPEPDRWRDRELTEMDEAWRYDHYVDLERVPAGALEAADRFTFLEGLYAAGIRDPHDAVGLLPYRILELYQRLASSWRRWHAETDPARRAWIEARIIDDAGVLGHFVTDASQPHHTTIHFNGWDADAPNPEAFTEDRTFHSRFERYFVDEHVSQPDIDRRVPSRPASVEGDARAEVLEFLRTSHAEVEALYRLDRDVGFDPDGALRVATRDFAADRLAAGSAMLASLWWSAWLEGSG